jgi:hypothetical protein
MAVASEMTAPSRNRRESEPSSPMGVVCANGSFDTKELAVSREGVVTMATALLTPY